MRVGNFSGPWPVSRVVERRALLVMLIGAVLCGLTTACGVVGGGADDGPLDVATSADLGDGWGIGLPDGWEVRSRFDEPRDRGDGCSVREAQVSTDSGTMEVVLVGPSCSSSVDSRGNGELASFSSADQLQSGDDLETRSTDLGRLTIATVDYYECTNDCDFYTPSVGVLELDEPVDPAFPAVMLIDDRGSTHEQVRFLAENLQRR